MGIKLMVGVDRSHPMVDVRRSHTMGPESQANSERGWKLDYR